MSPSIPHSGPPLSELLVAGVDPRSVDLCREIASTAGLVLRGTQDSEATLDALESGLVEVLLLSEHLPGGAELELSRHIRYGLETFANWRTLLSLPWHWAQERRWSPLISPSQLSARMSYLSFPL